MLNKLNLVKENLESIKTMNGVIDEKCKNINYDKDLVVKVFDSILDSSKYWVDANYLDVCKYTSCKYFRVNNTIVVERVEGTPLNECDKDLVKKVLNEQLLDLFDEFVLLGFKPYFQAHHLVIDKDNNLKVKDFYDIERISDYYDSEDICAYVDSFFYLQDQLDYLVYEEVFYNENNELKLDI